MKTTLLTDLTVADICEGFVYNELEQKGLFGWRRTSGTARCSARPTIVPRGMAEGIEC